MDLHPSQGLINTLLDKIHLDNFAKPWLGDTRYALLAIIAAATWHGIGSWVLLISAGIDRIPADLPDAARVDGSTDWQVFIHVTIPLLWEVLRILLVLWIIQALQAFTFIYVMTGPVSVGGPLGSTDVMATYVFRVAFVDFNWAYGAALATAMLAAILVLSVLVNRVTFRETIEY
jgi:ABC-type sugar transport system permease subunit